MTLVVDLGLSRVLENPEARSAALRELVAKGYTTCVRELIVPPGDDGLAQARVLEARQADGAAVVRWLEQDEAAELVAAVRKHYAKYGSYASFAWSELDDLPAYDVQPLALTLDGPEKPPGTRVHLPGVADSLTVRDLGSSIRNWTGRHPQARAATALHKLAQKYRLLVFSA